MASHLIDFQISRQKNGTKRQSRDIRILLSLGDHLAAVCDGDLSTLGEGDLLIVNPGSSLEILTDSVLYAVFRLNTYQFRVCFPGKECRFFGNSSREVSDNYILLRRLLSEVLVTTYESREYMEAELNRLYYELLIFLTNNFSAAEVGTRETPTDILADYIEAHYREDLSIRQVSSDFHMTSQYFSKYFKKHMGKTYYRYLSGVRLRHAVEDLLTSDRTLLQIALDNGFPNAESFHSYFLKTYDMTPAEYREKEQASAHTRAADIRQNLDEAVRKLGMNAPETDAAVHCLEVDASQKQTYTPYWSEFLNLGNLSVLSDSEVQRQVEELVHAFRYRYIRIQLDDSGYIPDGNYSFYSEARLFDSLVNYGLKIWIYMDFRLVKDHPHFPGYLNHLISFFSNRYSIGNVRSWRFELGYNTTFDRDKYRAYRQFHDRIRQILEQYEIAEPLLGGTISLGNPEGIETFLGYLRKSGIEMPAQTLVTEPYTIAETGRGIIIHRATDSSYIRNKLLTLSRHIPDFRDQVKRIYIIEKSGSLNKIDPMNDSCFKGASMLKNMIDCFGEIHGLAQELPLDILYTSDLQKGILFGGGGLLSKHDIRKPVYYACAFMGHAGSWYITKDSHSIVFSNGDANYQIICHNSKRLNYRYYHAENSLDLHHMEAYFDDTEDIRLTYRLRNVRNGSYIIKIRLISPDAGSVQDLLSRMQDEDGDVYVHPNDLEYLRQVSVPQLRLRKMAVTGNEMTINLTLKANEFAYLHIIYQY